MVTLTVDDRLLAAYVFYGSILMLKTSLMSFLTARHRIKNKVSVESYHISMEVMDSRSANLPSHRGSLVFLQSENIKLEKLD